MSILRLLKSVARTIGCGQVTAQGRKLAKIRHEIAV